MGPIGTVCTHWKHVLSSQSRVELKPEKAQPNFFGKNQVWRCWSSDRNKDFLRVKEDEANEQHRSIIEALRAAALEWTFGQINFVAGRRGAVVEDDFYNKLEKLNVQAGKRDKILLAHVQRICEAHDTVMRSYYQQIHGSSGADATMSMENIGEQVYV